MALFVPSAVPTIEIAWVSIILILTIYLFAFEVVSVDVAAITVMVLLGLTTLLAPYMGLEQGLVDNKHLFDGFSSNAVISIIAVMIIGAGLDKTGIMTKVAAFILKVGGTTESRIIPIISGTVGVISSFMQNVGAAALFLPVVSRISARSGLPMSRLLMPMGFTAILGGTMTMVGSSPLILLNDLILTSNKALSPEQQMETWGLFSVTPVGATLIICGILYFVVAGRYVLPKTKSESSTKGVDTMEYFKSLYGVHPDLLEVVVPDDSDLVGRLLGEIEKFYAIRAIGVKYSGDESWLDLGLLLTTLKSWGVWFLVYWLLLAVSIDLLKRIISRKELSCVLFSESLSSNKAGIAEVVIPPGSQLIGKSAREAWLRKRHGLGLIALHREGETMRQGEDIRSTPFQAGDTLVAHTTWLNLARLESNRNFVVVTTEYPREEESRPNKVWQAAVFFSIALFMVLFTDVRLSVALLTGAMGMVLSGVEH